MTSENNNFTYNPDVIDAPIQIHINEKKQSSYDDSFEINDIRSSPDFKGISFSNFKKTDVKQKMIDCMLGETIEPACYWCSELLCAGHFSDVWEIILYYISKHIQ